MKFALKTGVAGKRERNAMHHSSPSSDSSDFLKQRSGVELLLFLSSPSLSLSLSLNGFLLRRGNARARPSSPVSSRSRCFILAAVSRFPCLSTKMFWCLTRETNAGLRLTKYQFYISCFILKYKTAVLRPGYVSM